MDINLHFLNHCNDISIINQFKQDLIIPETINNTITNVNPKLWFILNNNNNDIINIIHNHINNIYINTTSHKIKKVYDNLTCNFNNFNRITGYNGDFQNITLWSLISDVNKFNNNNLEYKLMDDLDIEHLIYDIIKFIKNIIKNNKYDQTIIINIDNHFLDANGLHVITLEYFKDIIELIHLPSIYKINYILNNYHAFEIKIRNNKEIDSNSEMYMPLPIHSAVKLFDQDKSGAYFSENNTDFLQETAVIKNLQYNDEIGRAHV